MDATKNLVIKTYRHFMQDSLRRNSSLLVIAQAVNAVGALLFWVIAARLFPSDQVGLAVSFISFAALLSAFTNLGLPSTILRFLPRSHWKGGMVSAAILLVIVASAIGGFVGSNLIGLFVPKLFIVGHDNFLAFLLIAFVMLNGISALLDSTLLSFRKGQYVLAKAVIINFPRVSLPFIVVSLAARGLIFAYVVALFIGVSYNLIIITARLLHDQSFRPKIGKLLSHRSYAIGNYFGGILGVLPGTIVPIIVLDRLGAGSAAFFYIPLQIVGFLSIIASSTSQVLLSETSQKDSSEDINFQIVKAIKHLYSLLLPAVIGLIIIGWPMLMLFGRAYAVNGYLPLIIMIIASIFVAINWLGDTMLNIQRRALAYFIMNTLNAVLVVVFVYIVSARGLAAVSIAWMAAQFVSALMYLLFFGQNQISAFLLRDNMSR